jgi:hypothetical protein
MEKRMRTDSRQRPAPKVSRAKSARAAPVGPHQIAERAYQRFIERGGGHGLDVEDWLTAEADLKKPS